MIKEINLFEYLKDFESLRTALSDFYIKTKECRIFGAYENGVGAGFLLCGERRVREILVLRAENGGAEIRDGLLGAFLDTLPPGTAVRWRILNDAQNENTRIAVRHGFAAADVLRIFHFGRGNAAAARAVVGKYAPLFAFVERRGYVTKPLDQLTGDELRQIRDNPDGEFEAYLQSGEHIRGKTGRLDGKRSFAAVRDGRVFAYTVVVAHGEKNCVVENISVARSARRGGTVILPLLRTLDALLESDYGAASFAMYETNAEIMPMMKKYFSDLLTDETVQRDYVFTVGKKRADEPIS